MSVNLGIDKNSYLGTDFTLNFSTVDNITDALKSLGKGTHLCKIDVSRAFGLKWGDVNSLIPVSHLASDMERKYSSI